MELYYPHWIWITQSCWIRIGDSSVVAVAGDFPMPKGAVVEFTPMSVDQQYIAALSMDIAGDLYIGQSGQ
jgi:hypothetical protein